MRRELSVSYDSDTRQLVPGHLGKLVFGYLGDDTPAVLMVGRAQ